MTAPEGQGVTFVELFFDLVFVFALTELTGFTAHHLTVPGLARAVLLFWLIWWAWTQFSWALNGADTTRTLVRAGTLAATAVAFLMAISVPRAFEAGGGLWFVVPYIGVRCIGLGLYLRVAAGDAAWLRAVGIFGALSLLGLVAALIGAVVDPEARVFWWLGTIVLDLVAATRAGGEGAAWNLEGAHFSERHGLFVIIALGESLIAAAVSATEATRTGVLVTVGIGAVVLVCLLWWTYFGWFKEGLERALHERLAVGDAGFARDVYSFMHFPLIAGVVGVAVGLEAMVSHPATALGVPQAAALGGGLLLFVGMPAMIRWRAQGRPLVGRLVLLAGAPVILWLVHGLAPSWTLAGLVGLLAVLVAYEHLTEGDLETGAALGTEG